METDTQTLTKAERKALKKQQKQSDQERERRRQTLKKLMWYVVVVGAAVLIGYGIYNTIVPVPENEKHKPIDKISAGDWVRGNPQAPVLIIEYSDFQCPSCAMVSPVMDEVLKAYPTQVALVYRHFPLKQVHLQAELAAQAAEAAGTQGKFWEMHDLLFQNQTQWAENRGAKQKFGEYAKGLGLNIGQFNQDINSKEIRGLVKADYLSGLEQSLSSTPSFFINGEPLIKPEGFTGYKQEIDRLLQQATGSALPR
jgi:protein-disulfide isomerase